MRPAIRSVTVSGLPGYGTCTSLMPALLLEQYAAQMRQAAGADRTVGELAGLRLGERDEIGDAMHAERGIDVRKNGPSASCATGAKSLLMSSGGEDGLMISLVSVESGGRNSV